MFSHTTCAYSTGRATVGGHLQWSVRTSVHELLPNALPYFLLGALPLAWHRPLHAAAVPLGLMVLVWFSLLLWCVRAGIGPGFFQERVDSAFARISPSLTHQILQHITPSHSHPPTGSSSTWVWPAACGVTPAWPCLPTISRFPFLRTASLVWGGRSLPAAVAPRAARKPAEPSL